MYMTAVNKTSLRDNDENITFITHAEVFLLDIAIKVDISLVPLGNNTIFEETWYSKKISTLGPDLNSIMNNETKCPSLCLLDCLTMKPKSTLMTLSQSNSSTLPRNKTLLVLASCLTISFYCLDVSIFFSNNWNILQMIRKYSTYSPL